MTLTQKLEDARAAYHKLMTGTSARVIVDGADGSRLEFTAANKQSLYNYIKELESQLGIATGSNSYLTNGPARFVF